MSSDAPLTPGDDPAWMALLRSVLGPAADDAIAELRAAGFDPAQVAPAMPQDPAVLQQMFEQVRRMMSAPADGPVDWSAAHELARAQASLGGDPTPGEAERRAVTDAFSLAELWLDAVTDLPATGAHGRAWSRAEWVEATVPTWRRLTGPVAESLSTALVDAIGSGVSDEMGTNPFGVDLGGLVRRLGSTVFGLQVGQAAGTLAREVFGTTDIGLPLLATPVPALLPANVEEFATGLDVPPDEVRLYLALREAAATRLFTHVRWLAAHLMDAVAEYARGISIDTDQLTEAVRSVDPTDPQALQGALSGGVFAPHTTPQQKAALDRLETSLALVEGWVDTVSAQAATGHLPQAVALREMLRRRRAAGGPAEHTFATLVGLELRPRRLREAAALWEAIGAGEGQSARDAVWAHPDLMPNAQDLDDPAGYRARRETAADAADDLDRAIAQILEGDAGEDTNPRTDAGGS